MTGSPQADRALLQRFEPVLRYTRGEQFFPMDVAAYVQNCSLWLHRPEKQPVCLVPQGQLTLEKLAEPRAADFGAVYYLKFIEPLNITELAAYALQQGFAHKDPQNVFYAGPGRLARVGYMSRFLDALFSLSLFARGRVPGDTAAAAAMAYRRLLAGQEQYSYAGRVIRENGWITLQYWFFYPFNNWRSGFSGANDHEADWEMICLYLYEANGDLQPEWVAYASHDFFGDDFRRRWDDPELEKMGEHPVVYVGAGSHSCHFARGEYLTELELPPLAPLVRLVDRQKRFWQKLFRLDASSEESDSASPRPGFNIFRIPFVDYARGDGLAIGPGQEKTWAEPRLLEPTPPWALHYRGLWGLYARDPFSSENAPAGPVYNRDGSMRRAWYDPLGWAGLDKLPPPNRTLSHVLEQWVEVEARQSALAETIAQKSRDLVKMGVEANAMRGQAHLRQLHAIQQEKIEALSEELNQMRAELAADQALLEALGLYAARLRTGQRSPARAHLRHARHPASAARLRFNRFAEAWAAVSIGLMLISFVILVFFGQQYLIWGIVALLSLMIFVEAGFRRQLARLVTSLTIGLAIVSLLIIVYDFFWPIVIVALLLTGGYIMWENVRELWG
ncbi:MAG: hypothetical protein Fur0044_50340 [Anaerolineae bacterium]|nr:hypothetical protein [Anaerolineae bacterium]